MDNHRSGMLLLIIIELVALYSTYGTVYFTAICSNATDQCDSDYIIQCSNVTLNVDTVYYVDTSCEGNGTYNWCYNFITPVDTENETLSSMFADLCYNTTKCNLSSINDMSTGRYLLEYSCGSSDIDVPPGNAAAIAITMICVAIIIVLSVGTTVVFIRRRRVTPMNGAGHDNPLYNPDLLIDNYQDVEERSATFPEDQDHDYDHVQSSGIVAARPNANYDTIVHGVIGSKPEYPKAQNSNENENKEGSGQESRTSEYDRIVLGSIGVAGTRVPDCSAYGDCASDPQELKEKDNEQSVKQSSDAPELGTTMAFETEEKGNEDVQSVDDDVEYSQPVKRQQQTN